MLKVVTGRFHPSLESAFVEQIQRLKAADPWAKVAIVVPSTPILDRIRRLLALERRLSLLNLHLLTFHHLALRLADEEGRPAHAQLRIVGDLFFEHLVRHVVEQRLAESPALGRLGQSFGTWAALWSTIRDLKDGGVSPDTALEALREGCFGLEDREWLDALFALQSTIQALSASLHVGTADDLAHALVSAVPTSPFLRSLSHAYYYGFYDLTQVQLSLFQAVSTTIPTTLFFPLAKDASFAFARRFFDRHIQPLLGSDPPIECEADDTRVPPTLSVQSVIGLEEELSATCRAILDLVETHGYRFNEIGVVARTLDPYRGVIQLICDRHRIPRATTVGRPLIQQPLCKTLLLLAALPLNDFYRAGVLDVVTSPFYATPLGGDGTCSPAYRPEQWKAVLEALHITHGRDEWRRLEQCCQSALELNGGADETGGWGSFKVLPEVIALLWQTVSRLLTSYVAVPTQGTCKTLLEALRRLIEEHLRRSVDGQVTDPDDVIWSQAAQWEAIDQTLAGLAELNVIGHELSWAEFLELLTHAFERKTVLLQPVSAQGVMFMDAMAARGVPFRALFVLGLNEKVFPRYIPEDPFLRDGYRRVLETTLGYKVDEKLTGYDEESLLFTLLTQAASERLYLSFQRADHDGRVLAPSPYVNEARHRSATPARPVDIIPRRLTERIIQRPTMSRFLPPADLAQWMAVNDQDPVDVLQAIGREAAMFRDGIQMLGRTEDEHHGLTAYDGLAGPLEPHWTGLVKRGLAPTPLERYARCPFRYFAADVLRLRPIRVPDSDELDARLLGTFCHAALRRCYELLLPTGWPAKPVTDDTIDWCIETAVEEAARDVERRHRTGHYLLWELAKTSIADVMTAAVDEDARAYRHAPFAPVAFEVAGEGTITDVPGPGLTPLKIRGRIDRLDRHRDSGSLRVIDYKFKIGKSISPEDRNLNQSAIRGQRLQPPLYALLEIPDHGTADEVQFLFLGPSWGSPVARSSFDANIWSAETGIQLRNTLGRLMAGIRNGQFFIMPDASCKTCDYRIACRREHPPTFWRTSRAVESKDLASLRSLQVNK
jgi:ATP-dependent helicase/nuclease subunit B